MRVVVGRVRRGDGERALGGSPGSDRARLCERLGASASGAAGTAAAAEAASDCAAGCFGQRGVCLIFGHLPLLAVRPMG